MQEKMAMPTAKLASMKRDRSNSQQMNDNQALMLQARLEMMEPIP